MYCCSNLSKFKNFTGSRESILTRFFLFYFPVAPSLLLVGESFWRPCSSSLMLQINFYIYWSLELWIGCNIISKRTWTKPSVFPRGSLKYKFSRENCHNCEWYDILNTRSVFQFQVYIRVYSLCFNIQVGQCS